MSQKIDIREHLIQELKKDVFGPREEEEIFWADEGDVPTSRYVTGVLYPKQTRLDENNHLSDSNEGDSKEDDEDGEIVDEDNPVRRNHATQVCFYLAHCTLFPKQKTPRRNEGF